MVCKGTLCLLLFAPLLAFWIGSSLGVSASGVSSSILLSESRMWVEPLAVSVQGSVGSRFNVTVWANISQPCYTWQFALNFNSNYFTARRLGYTAGSTSAFFSGHATIQAIDSSNAGIGESLLGTDSRATGSGSLAWVELEVKTVPPQSQTLSINNTDTFVLSGDLNEITTTRSDATVTFTTQSASRMWVEPSAVWVPGIVGYRFNVTVWANISQPCNTWQFALNFNSNYFTARRVGYTAGSTSAFFSGYATIPGITSSNACIWESLHGTDSRAAGSGSLAWVELEVKTVPPQSQTLSINNTDTFVLRGGDLYEITTTRSDARALISFAKASRVENFQVDAGHVAVFQYILNKGDEFGGYFEVSGGDNNDIDFSVTDPQLTKIINLERVSQGYQIGFTAQLSGGYTLQFGNGFESVNAKTIILTFDITPPNSGGPPSVGGPSWPLLRMVLWVFAGIAGVSAIVFATRAREPAKTLRRGLMLIVIFGLSFTLYYPIAQQPAYARDSMPRDSFYFELATILLVTFLFSALEKGLGWPFIFGNSLTWGLILGYNFFFGYPYWLIVLYLIGGGFFLGFLYVFLGGIGQGLVGWTLNRKIAAQLKARAEEERRRVEEEQKRLEAERNHIEDLISETRSMLESEELDATKAKNDSWLIAVKFTKSELEGTSQLFETGETAVSDAKERVLFLKEQAEILNKPPHEGVPEKTPYDILGVSPQATQKEIEDRYRDLSKKYHTDTSSRWVKQGESMPEEIRDYMNTMFDKITKAKDECLRNASEGKSS